VIREIRAGCAVLAERYRRDQRLIEKLLVLSVALLIVIAVMAVLIGSGAATMLAIAVFGLSAGLGISLSGGLAIGTAELRRRDRERKDLP
jgi:hypothetical protein